MARSQLLLKRVREHTFYFLNVRVDNTDVETSLETVHALTYANEKTARSVFFTNVHTIQLAQSDNAFRDCVNNADMVLPDGIGLKIGARLFGKRVRENLNGTDLAPTLFRYAQTWGRSVYLLGATQEVIDACRRKLQERYPGLQVLGSHNGYFSEEEEEKILGDINQQHPDFLFVALGSPRQEEWIERHRQMLRTRVCFAVGGLFDFIGGKVRRAPIWIRKVHCEWLFRFIQDPKAKWSRVFVDIPKFLLLLLNRRLTSSKVAEL